MISSSPTADGQHRETPPTQIHAATHERIIAYLKMSGRKKRICSIATVPLPTPQYSRSGVALPAGISAPQGTAPITLATAFRSPARGLRAEV